ncbi:2Fe-2S iron-sulfur cluster binding domain-containing protein [Halonotius terrestris]|uniref:2Fe-2S iron-sulfur cluster binding domain-containing protein n=1 Tax=Halonotius terrestris TaxID=2487750 RepID=A0A8J8PAG3_9EURY|nr:ferredoxin Fer [Halonotius terrestris]TQQ82866.1 2Fe-2S iron-sulfur cluster binding domain-containing protein [Halonotius terrestris]
MDPFAVLGVDRDADDETIKRAYRRRAKETHPDRGGTDAEFKRVKDAYETIQAGEVDDDTEAFVDDLGSTTGDPATPPEPEPSTEVTYLNYEVLSDRGWSLDDDDLFEKAAAADLDDADYGQFEVEGDRSLLEAAEDSGHAWPFACRGGACANCAVAVTDGELSQLVDHILPDELTDEGIRLSCNGKPLTDTLEVVYNLEQREDLADLKLPADRFNKARADD